MQAEPRECPTSHRRAYDWRNSSTQYNERKNFLQGLQPNWPLAGAVHEPCADRRFKSVADIDQDGGRQWTVKPQDVA
ncbi:hypothetical protein J2W42_005356 [Rhizobium tibeticum]|nr:hypothetical protein [Rhizobium tibeticum]